VTAQVTHVLGAAQDFAGGSNLEAASRSFASALFKVFHFEFPLLLFLDWH